jgi:F0F1-type ATP synthase membrane subunit c/vacuolar-type H+-ATPase subunit K
MSQRLSRSTLPRLAFALAVLAALGAGIAQADTTFSVTNSGVTAYLVSGFPGNNPTLTLRKGDTYQFQVNASGHPFFISTATHSPSGPHFTAGVSNENVEVGTLTFVVPASAPATLFYQCGIHSGMSGQLTIVDAAATVPAAGLTGWIVLAALVSGLGLIALRRRARAGRSA